MTASHPILSRIDSGRPLLVSGDPAASLRARGIALHPPAALARLLREHPAAVRELHQADIAAGVDVIACLTADTIPRALHEIGMMFRAAALTGTAIDFALDAVEQAPRPVAVAGVLGNADVAPVAEDRLGEELGTHAARLAAAGCELILARGFSVIHASPTEAECTLARLSRRAAIVSGATAQLHTWAVAALDARGCTLDGEPADECARHAFGEGAELVLFEIPVPPLGTDHDWIERVFGVGHARIGFALAAGGLEPDAWAHEAHRLLERGVRVIGGGPGTTTRHLSALSALLRANERHSRWPRAV